MNKGSYWANRRRDSKEIPIGRNVLLMCCGECTEPNYFDYYLKIIKNNMEKKSKGITSFKYEIVICPVDPASMVRKTIDKVSISGDTYSEVYVIFDKDSFKSDNFDNSIMKIENYNNDECHYTPLWSNQCIELWFLLHFEYMHSQLERKSYFVKLSKYLGIKYVKNISDIGERLLISGGSLNMAISNSKKLKESYGENKSFSLRNPCTNIDVFFEYYKDYIR